MAIKVLDKVKLRSNITCIMEEVAILHSLDHPNIVKYYETYNDSKYIYLVMEYITGMPLFDKITQQENQTFTEEIAAHYMKSLFQAINHCHAQHIVHRDIKPDNIMITNDNTVRLIDFGLSKASKKKQLTTMAGTPYYMAPEVLEGAYTNKADLWSLGVLLYTLVSGYLPFQGANQHEVFKKIKAADFHFNHTEFNSVSDECKDLIKKLLVTNQKKRISGVDALKHPWFKMSHSSQQQSAAPVKISNEVISRLRSFKGVSTFKKAAMNLLVKTASEAEVQDLRAQFQAIDTDGTGMIKAEEMKEILMAKRMNVSDAEVNEMISQMDYHNNKKINYSEFLAATIDVRNFLTESRLKAVFNQFDTDSSGKITEENIHLAMQKLGREISREEVHQMIQQHDQTGDGCLNFNEFKNIFFEGKEIEDDLAGQQPFGADGPTV